MYKIIGADGREYGPVTVEQIQQWIRDGRANTQTKVQAVGGAEWKTLSSFPELLGDTAGLNLPPTVPSLFTPKTNGMAIAGLVMGILSLIQCCSFIFGILGVIFSSIGLSQINKKPEELKGKSIAVAGLIMSIVGLVINIVLVVVYWATITGALATHH